MRTQFGVTASERQKRGDVELVHNLQDAAGARNLAFDLRTTHDRYGSSAQLHHNGLLTHPLHLTAQRKIDEYQRQYANNQNITFVPAIMSISTRESSNF